MSDQVVIQLRIGQAALDELDIPFAPQDQFPTANDAPHVGLMLMPDGVYRLMVDPTEVKNVAAGYKEIRKFHPGAPKGK